MTMDLCFILKYKSNFKLNLIVLISLFLLKIQMMISRFVNDRIGITSWGFFIIEKPFLITVSLKKEFTLLFLKTKIFLLNFSDFHNNHKLLYPNDKIKGKKCSSLRFEFKLNIFIFLS